MDPEYLVLKALDRDFGPFQTITPASCDWVERTGLSRPHACRIACELARQGLVLREVRLRHYRNPYDPDGPPLRAPRRVVSYRLTDAGRAALV